MKTPTIIADDLVDHQGNHIADPFAADVRTAVYFMRTADCPACQKHVKELKARAAEFAQQGCATMVIVPDGVEAAGELFASIHPPFPIATSASFHDAVGLQEKVFGKVRQSGVFLVDQAGTVLYSHTATLPPMSLKIKELSAAVDKAAQAG